MEIKEAVEILKNDGLEEDGNAGENALEDIIEAFKNGYTLCKVDEAVEKMKERGHSLPVHMVEEILKEACK